MEAGTGNVRLRGKRKVLRPNGSDVTQGEIYMGKKDQLDQIRAQVGVWKSR